MTVLRLRFVHSFVDKTGRRRFYFRHKGQRWSLPGQPGTVEFTSRYTELLEKMRGVISSVEFAPATLGAVIESI